MHAIHKYPCDYIQRSYAIRFSQQCSISLSLSLSRSYPKCVYIPVPTVPVPSFSVFTKTHLFKHSTKRTRGDEEMLGHQ